MRLKCSPRGHILIERHFEQFASSPRVSLHRSNDQNVSLMIAVGRVALYTATDGRRIQSLIICPAAPTTHQASRKKKESPFAANVNYKQANTLIVVYIYLRCTRISTQWNLCMHKCRTSNELNVCRAMLQPLNARISRARRSARY